MHVFGVHPKLSRYMYKTHVIICSILEGNVRSFEEHAGFCDTDHKPCLLYRMCTLTLSVAVGDSTWWEIILRTCRCVHVRRSNVQPRRVIFYIACMLWLSFLYTGFGKQLCMCIHCKLYVQLSRVLENLSFLLICQKAYSWYSDK